MMLQLNQNMVLRNKRTIRTKLKNIYRDKELLNYFFKTKDYIPLANKRDPPSAPTTPKQNNNE